MKIANSLLVLILIAIILPMLLVMLPSNYIHFMLVSGSSMEPTITENDIIAVIPIDYSKVSTGDVISYRYSVSSEDEVIITHRMVGNKNGLIRTKGDAYAEPDPYLVAPEDVIGVMKLKIPFVGFLVHFARTTQGLMGLVVLPAVLLMVQEMKGLIKGV